jgi:hypothetical protein
MKRISLVRASTVVAVSYEGRGEWGVTIPGQLAEHGVSFARACQLACQAQHPNLVCYQLDEHTSIVPIAQHPRPPLWGIERDGARVVPMEFAEVEAAARWWERREPQDCDADQAKP